MKSFLASKHRVSHEMWSEAAAHRPAEAFTHSIVRYVHFLQVPKSQKCSFWDDLKVGKDKPPEKRVDIKYHNASIH